MKQPTILVALVFLALASLAVAEAPSRETQIAGALAALPDAEHLETTTVQGHDGEGGLLTLREGEGPWICLADDASDDRFHAACYHRSLEPFMARGRELKAEGVGGADRHTIRHEEVDAGKLEMPRGPTTLASVSGKAYDPLSGKIDGESRIYVVYIPYATPESTGLPIKPNMDQPSAPWIMRQGTASAHIMITPGPVAAASEEAAE